MKWTLENRALPSPEEMERLRSETRAALDHPQRKELAIYEARLLGQKDIQETEVWINPGESTWRLNRTNAYLGHSEYSDFAKVGDVHWCLTASQLIVGTPQSPEPGYDYSQVLEMSLTHLNWALSGGMWTAYANHLGPPTVRLQGAQWTAESRDEARGLIFVAKGRWFDEENSGSITEVTVRQQRQHPDDWEARFVCAGRRYIAELDRWAPERVEAWYGTPPRLDRVYQAVTVEFIEPAHVEVLTRMPDFAGADPVRGKLAISSILDLRPGSRGYQKLTDTGTEFIPIEQTEAARHHRRLTWYGWISGGAVSAALVVLHLRRRMASPTPPKESIA